MQGFYSLCILLFGYFSLYLQHKRMLISFYYDMNGFNDIDDGHYENVSSFFQLFINYFTGI
jgi:hypothetical protein